MKPRYQLVVALLAAVLVACSTAEKPLEPTSEGSGDLFVSPPTLELEAGVGRSVEASFFYFNASGAEETVFTNTFAVGWLGVIEGNAQATGPYGFGAVTLRATCDERQLGFVAGDELFTVVRVFLGGAPNVKAVALAPEVTLRCR